MSPRNMRGIPALMTLRRGAVTQVSQTIVVIGNATSNYTTSLYQSSDGMSKRLLVPKRLCDTRTGSSTTEMSYLDNDHQIEAPPGTSELYERRVRNTDTNFQPDSQDLPVVLEWPVADKTPYPPPLQNDTTLRNFLNRYGNPPKPSPFRDNFTGELDYRALEKYYGCRYPQKSSSIHKPRISTDQTDQPRRTESPDRTLCTTSNRWESLDRTLRTPSVRPPPLTGANAIPLGPRRRGQIPRSTSRNEQYGSMTVLNQ